MVTEEIVETFHDMIFVYQGTKVREVDAKLGMVKQSALWMPRLLSVDNKRLSTSEQCLGNLFRGNPQEFLHCVVAVGETWIH